MNFISRIMTMKGWEHPLISSKLYMVTLAYSLSNHELFGFCHIATSLFINKKLNQYIEFSKVGSMYKYCINIVNGSCDSDIIDKLSTFLWEIWKSFFLCSVAYLLCSGYTLLWDIWKSLFCAMVYTFYAEGKPGVSLELG